MACAANKTEGHVVPQGLPHILGEGIEVVVNRRCDLLLLVNKQATSSTTTDPSNLFAFDDYLKGRNLTRTTGYRYRQAGILQAVNIHGRLYITRQEIANFERRAVAGEFTKKAKASHRSEQAAA